MKKILLVVLLASAISARAEHLSADLKIVAFDHTWISASVDHGFLSHPEQKLMFTGLSPGRHFLEVIGYGNHPHGPFGHGRLLFRGFVDLPAAALVKGKVNRWGAFRIKKIIPRHVPVVHHYAPPVPYAMDEFRFRELMDAVRDQHFDSSRLLVARQGLDGNFMTAGQVRRLMELMTFESTRLKLAKYAYESVIDKDRFFIVNDAFTFSSSVRELDRYIRNYG